MGPMLRSSVLLFCLLFGLTAGYAQASCGSSHPCVDVSWTPGTGGASTASYNVKRATTSGGPYTTIANVGAPTTAYTDLSGPGNVLTEGTVYFYVFSAVNSGGESPNSTETSARIPVTPTLPPTPINPTATAH